MVEQLIRNEQVNGSNPFTGSIHFTMKTLHLLLALPFALNILANLVFTPIQFGLRNLLLASFDISIVLVTIVWGMIVIWRYHRWVAVLQVPYLIWVAIATVLQVMITWLNVISPSML